MERRLYLHFARRAVRSAVRDARCFLKDVDPSLDIRCDNSYDFSGCGPAVAIYEHDTVFSGCIAFAVNHETSRKTIEDCFSVFDDLKDMIRQIRWSNRVSVFHELGHGLHELLADAYGSVPEYRSAVDGAGLSELFAPAADKEDIVEEFGRDFEDFVDPDNDLMKAIHIYKNLN